MRCRHGARQRSTKRGSCWRFVKSFVPRSLNCLMARRWKRPLWRRCASEKTSWRARRLLGQPCRRSYAPKVCSSARCTTSQVHARQRVSKPVPPAFEVINATYRSEVDAIAPLVEQAQQKIDNAIGFVEDCFGDGREMLVFLAELSTGTTTMRFISHFGSDAYYARNDVNSGDETNSPLAR